MAAKGQIAFQQTGLGGLLKQYRLRVPPNQREYAWTKKEVTTLLQDFARAISDGDSEYFLGTIVTIPQSPSELEVVDGQQRLATTAILLAEIRDYLRGREDIIAQDIDQSMLNDVDRALRERVPKLQLNLDDNEYFRAAISGGDPGEPERESHRLIADAFAQCHAQVRKVVSGLDEKSHGDLLNKWLDFIEHGAQVILLKVPSDVNAYTMFETLNDRGLKTSQSDLVKNYLFGQSSARLAEAQQKWALMRGALESLDEDDITVTFLRSALILIQGYLREAEVYERVQRQARGPQQTIMLLTNAERLANSYVAMFNPDHEDWNEHPSSIHRAIKTLNLLNVKPMRPLMLAVAAKFKPKEAAIAFEKFVSWKARFLIAGSTRTGGTIELPLAHAARRVFNGDITTAAALSAELAGSIPSNEDFRRQFEVATVAKSSLARYYLRSLESTAANDDAPWYVPNDDSETINLEHVLPRNPEGNWPQFEEAEVRQNVRRIGNLALLQATRNSNLRSASFAEKRPVFATSPYLLTKELADVDDWSPANIETRQRRLAELALQTWRL